MNKPRRSAAAHNRRLVPLFWHSDFLVYREHQALAHCPTLRRSIGKAPTIWKVSSYESRVAPPFARFSRPLKKQQRLHSLDESVCLSREAKDSGNTSFQYAVAPMLCLSVYLLCGLHSTMSSAICCTGIDGRTLSSLEASSLEPVIIGQILEWLITRRPDAAKRQYYLAPVPSIQRLFTVFKCLLDPPLPCFWPFEKDVRTWLSP